MNRSEEGSGVAVLRRFKAVPFAALLLVVMVAQAQAQSVRTHHVRREVANGQAKFLNRMPGTQTMQIDMVLTSRDPAGLDSFLQEVYDPTSPSYRHFLTPQQFTEKFGPTQQDYDAAVGFAKSYGLKVVGGSRDGMDIQLAGSVTSIEAAFNISMGVYQHPTENRSFYAPDREPTVGLPFSVWHISGLDNFATPHSALVHKSQAQTATSNATTGSGPSASYLGSDMRAAYYGGPLTGAGQYVGLLEYYGYDTADLTTYFTNANQSNNVPITGISTDGTSISCVYSKGCDDTEQILDITQAVSMAPGMSALYVFVGSTDTAILSAMSTKLPLAAQIGSSWAWSPGDPVTDDPYFKKFAAQGQNFFQAAGDSGKYTSTSTYVFPADDAYVTTVGGTDLNATGAGGAWASETTWVDGGGGYYTKDAIGIPSWQVPAITGTNLGSTTYRNAPDVAANSNFTYYVCADQTTCTANSYGGTSFAAPLWAGYMALVNQQALANGNTVLGFINPLIYSIGLSSGYSAAFHDVTSGSNGFTAITGYDLATGWGSMNGAGLLNALAGTPSGPNFTLSASPASVTVTQGSGGSSTVTATISGGFNAAIALSASGQPSGVTVGFSPASIAAPGSGSSGVTLTVASNPVTGTYPITITGIGGGITQTTTLSLTVVGPANFTISASPTAVSLARGSKGTSTITTAISGSFSSAIGLSASGQPSGVTVSFSKTSIAAPGSGTSTLTLTVGTTAATGTYPITITGTGGGLTHTTTVNLTVTVPPSFAVSVSPTSISVTRGSSGTATVTTTVAGGFNAAVALSASGQPSGVTVGFSPSSIAAPGAGTSTVTFTVSSSARRTTRSITIKATSGSTSHTTTVSLTVK
jgi:subtilase family serine protease